MESGYLSLPPPGFGTRPWLIQAHGRHKETVTFVDMLDRSAHEALIPDMQDKICLGCVYGGDWFLMLDEISGDCFLLHLTAYSCKIPLPPLEFLGRCAVLGSPANPWANPNCTVVITSVPEYSGQNFLLHCHSGDEDWTKLAVHDSGWIYGHITSCAGKLYAAAVNNLLAIDVVDGAIQTEGMHIAGKEASDLSLKNYFVESCGVLFEVRVEYLGRPDDGAIVEIIVHRLDLSVPDPIWMRVESIGDDRAFLLAGDYGSSCPAVEGLTQGNCIYLVWSSCDCERLYKFCLDDRTISFHKVLPSPTQAWCRAFWAIPESIQAAELKEPTFPGLPSNEANLLSDSELFLMEKHAVSSAPWHDLLPELLPLLVSKLSCPVDILLFRAVCKSWNIVPSMEEQDKVWPWLMHCSKQDGTCKMFDPLRGKEYTLSIDAFKSDDRTILRSSKDGWVFVSTGDEIDDIFIINPFTEDIMELPMFDRCYHFHGVSFSSTPCFVLVDAHVSGLRRIGQEDWQEIFLEFQVPFPVAYNNPVYYRGGFYCLGRKGNIGVFDPNDRTWTVLDKPEPIHGEPMNVFDEVHEGSEFCYLVVLAGELISVFQRSADEPPRVFKLDEAKMAWIQVEDIGGAALFLDYRSSFAVASPEAGHGNKIYFPRYSEDAKQAAFYDLETKTYSPAYYGLKSPTNCGQFATTETKICSVVIIVFLWIIWKCRNTKIFRHDDEANNLVAAKCRDDLALWPHRCGRPEGRALMLERS
ncbi:hypothetical protein EJB05_48845, partial [Eragrostis curvula]